jgi:hypothetical protein
MMDGKKKYDETEQGAVQGGQKRSNEIKHQESEEVRKYKTMSPW